MEGTRKGVENCMIKDHRIIHHYFSGEPSINYCNYCKRFVRNKENHFNKNGMCKKRNWRIA